VNCERHRIISTQTSCILHFTLYALQRFTNYTIFAMANIV